jgi:hypothetical protein
MFLESTHYFNLFLPSFCLIKKKQKNQGEKPYPFFLRSQRLRNAARKNAYRTFSPKSATLLPTYAAGEKNFKLNLLSINSD